MLLGATEPVDGEAMDEGLRQGNVLSGGFSSFGPSGRNKLYIIFVSADPVWHGMALLHPNARSPAMADSGSSWTGAPDPIKIGWLGSALDGPEGGYNKIHRMAFDEALEEGLLDRPVIALAKQQAHRCLPAAD